jgi:hypothetical protein
VLGKRPHVEASSMKPLDETYEPVVIEDDDDVGSNRSTNQPLLELARTRMSRRTALKGSSPRRPSARSAAR